DESQGWAWVQACRDGYVGYLRVGALGARERDATHVVAAARTFIYPDADMKLPHSNMLSMGASVVVVGTSVTRGTSYAHLPSGEAVVMSHLIPADEHQPDFVGVAETL